MRLLLSAYPLGSFIVYWLNLLHGDTFNVQNLMWGVLATIILTVALYLYFPLSKMIERLSLAWSLGVIVGSTLFFLGLILQHVIGNAWGGYMWFLGLWITVHFLGLSKKDSESY